MRRIALTGGIASGKGVVANCFQQLGVPVVDADIASRTVVQPGRAGLDAIVTAFGDAILNSDGTLDRTALRQRIFADADARRRLNAILHPHIRAEMAARLADAEADGAAYALAVIPLLVETGQGDAYDRVLVVDCPETCQRARLRARDGLDTAAIDAALASQASREQRLAYADDVIVNDTDYNPATDLAPRVATLDQTYRALAQSGTDETDR